MSRVSGSPQFHGLDGARSNGTVDGEDRSGLLATTDGDIFCSTDRGKEAQRRQRNRSTKRAWEKVRVVYPYLCCGSRDVRIPFCPILTIVEHSGNHNSVPKKLTAAAHTVELRERSRQMT